MSKTSKPVWITTDEYAVIIFKGEPPKNLQAGTPLHKEVMSALIIDQDWDKAYKLLTPERVVETVSKGELKLDHVGTLKDKDNTPVDPLVRDYLDDFMKKGLSLKPLVFLAENIKKAKSQFVRDQMVRFLRAGKFQITEDGCFIAFKGVSIVGGKLVDKHSGTFSNEVGVSPRMDYDKVDDNPHETCSRGLHVGSWGYMGHYSSSTDSILAVKVNPADVVSVPYEYQDQKMRTCGYTVMARDLKSPEDFQVVLPLHTSTANSVAAKVLPVKKVLVLKAPVKKTAVKKAAFTTPRSITGEVIIDLNDFSGSQIISLTWLQCRKRILISQKSKVRVLKYAVEHFQASKLHVKDTRVKVQTQFIKQVTSK
jgi:hypothetical protein